MTGRRTTTHYRRGGTSACTARIRPPALTADCADVTCKNCTRTRAYTSMAGLPVITGPPVPPVADLPSGAVADAADVPVLTEWLKRTG